MNLLFLHMDCRVLVSLAERFAEEGYTLHQASFSLPNLCLFFLWCESQQLTSNKSKPSNTEQDWVLENKTVPFRLKMYFSGSTDRFSWKSSLWNISISHCFTIVCTCSSSEPGAHTCHQNHNQTLDSAKTYKLIGMKFTET